MPAFSELQKRLAKKESTTRPREGNYDEILVSDARGRLTPASMVEQKLRMALMAAADPAIKTAAN